MTAAMGRTNHVSSTDPASQTPMMRQYLAAKAEHPDAIVLFRMGDFYETFYEDAQEVADLLELTLTSRNKKDDDPIPMAGVPHHALGAYLPRLLSAGRRVAICEQMEDPRQAKGIVRRAVVRVVTPGVILDDVMLDGARNNFLAAIWRGSDKGPVGLAWVDASTGERRGAVVAGLDRAISELGRIEPTELLVDRGQEDLLKTVGGRLPGAVLSPVSVTVGGASDPLATADGMVDAYLAATQKDARLPLKPLCTQDLDGSLRLGAETVRNLELLRTMNTGTRKGSVLGLMDRTRTCMGGRKLKQWLLYPLTEPVEIRRRLDAVEAFVVDPITRSNLRAELKGVADLERLVTRTVANAATPRDLVALSTSLTRTPAVAQLLQDSGAPPLAQLAQAVDPVTEASSLVQDALVDEPPALLKDGGVIREGFHRELDVLIEVARDGKAWFGRYAESLRQETGIQSLKVRYNNVFGYFIEVTRANLQHVPDTWLRKQTLANSERYYTPELKEREETVLGAHDRRIALEHEIFDEVRRAVADVGTRIQATADLVAVIDVHAGLAELAQHMGYTRPAVDSGLRIEIEDGRHPVIEGIMPAGEFVPNDVILDASGGQILIITGPNMAGKSTVMRQVALIVVMAQLGSFVPAARAHIGIVDQVFTRVGASDNLAAGQSTFMVEMTETAAILADATERSLVILDEIGRGTSTYDGVSIAWAVAEHLHEVIGARTLFATHYHELTELAGVHERIVNMTIAVKRWKDDIVFLRRLIPGGTSHSYGIQVAKLAGLPDRVLNRAKGVLENLEAAAMDRDSRPRAGRGNPADGEPGWQLNLFAVDPRGERLARRLAEVDPDDLTPRQALAILFELRGLLDEDPH